MHRQIVSFTPDEFGDWVAALDCWHRQHVRHQPPIWPKPWVRTVEGRSERVGSTLDCPLCDRCELPSDLVVVRSTATWSESSVPPALLRDHRVASGTWGRVCVKTGSLHFHADTDPATDVTVHAGDTQAIPPDVVHRVRCDEPVLFALEFLGPTSGQLG